MYNIDVMH
jgi:hypothetical protein